MNQTYHLGTVLKELRLQQQLSQVQVATDICSQAMLSRIEKNDVIPSVILVKLICDRLNVTVDFVLNHSDPDNIPHH